MENITTNIDLTKVKEYILRADITEKMEIARFIDKITLTKRLAEISDTFKKIQVTDEEILAEIEIVREKNYHVKKLSSDENCH